jgi:hypothetical protein
VVEYISQWRLSMVQTPDGTVASCVSPSTDIVRRHRQDYVKTETYSPNIVPANTTTMME